MAIVKIKAFRNITLKKNVIFRERNKTMKKMSVKDKSSSESRTQMYDF